MRNLNAGSKRADPQHRSDRRTPRRCAVADLARKTPSALEVHPAPQVASILINFCVSPGVHPTTQCSTVPTAGVF